MGQLTHFPGFKSCTGFKFSSDACWKTINPTWKDYFTEEILVTSGRSCFSRSKGLRINLNETLASFFAHLAPSPVETNLVSESAPSSNSFPNAVKACAGKSRFLDIAFMRTVRVPDDGKVHNLPPGLGRFPLFNVGSFKDRLPPEMVDKGGIFFPIYRELWNT